MGPPDLTIRWTIGDVHPYGFESLRLSIGGARRLFGAAADLVVCVNSKELEAARRAAGTLPDGVRWMSAGDFPPWLAAHLDPGLADGVAWKLSPVRIGAGRELALDNDVILWEVPAGIRNWLDDPDPRACCLAEDVRAFFGEFAGRCGTEPRHAGIRGVGPGVDLESALTRVLAAHPGVVLRSETDAQGLQVVVLTERPHHVVPTADVSICSPWPVHQTDLGRCGAHFVGLNAHAFPEEWGGRRAREEHETHWRSRRPEIYRRLGLDPDPVHRRAEAPAGAPAHGSAIAI